MLQRGGLRMWTREKRELTAVCGRMGLGVLRRTPPVLREAVRRGRHERVRHRRRARRACDGDGGRGVPRLPRRCGEGRPGQGDGPAGMAVRVGEA